MAAAFVLVVDCVSLAREEFRYGGPGPLAAVETRIAAIARTEGVSVAYSDYWSASSLSWASHMSRPTFPIQRCGATADTGFCPMYLNAITSWYLPRPGARSMLIMSAGSPFLPPTPDPRLGPALRRYSVPPYTLYVYGDDVAARFG